MPSPESEATGTLDLALHRTARLLMVNPKLAEQQASEILTSVPNHPVATLMLGKARRQLGNPAAAIATLEPLTKGQPRWAPGFFEYAMALLESNLHQESLKALRRVVSLEPAFPDAWRTIGDILTAQGDAAGADVAYAEHIKASTQDPRLLAAASALCENRIPEAEYRLREHLKQYPTDVAAIRMLAEVGGRLGRYGDSEKLLRRAVELAPSFYPARHNLALVLHRQNKYAQALEQLEFLCSADPANSGHRNLKAVVLAKLGEFPQSLEIYADVLAKHPDQAKIWESYAHVLASAGYVTDSVAAYRRCLEITPRDGSAYWSMANLKTFRFTNQDIACMREILSDPSTPVDDQAPLHFAIGKALEDSARYEDAFTHYSLGNALRHSQTGFVPADTTLLVKRSIQLFTQEFIDAHGDRGDPAVDPIFIVGLPRAGSTLIEQILSSHSEVEGTMELPNIMTMAATLGGRKSHQEHSSYPEALANLSGEELKTLGEQYLSETRIHRKTGRRFFIDKMPNNFLHVGLIKLILPRAKIIDARRHPLSCCFSAFKQNFSMGQRFTYSLENLGVYYRDYVELMTHFDTVLPGAIYRVIYERMVEHTESEVRGLLAYCGLNFEESCLRFYENARGVRTPSAQQVRQPIYREGMDQWRHFEPWLDPLKRALGDVLTSYPDTPEYQNGNK